MFGPFLEIWVTYVVVLVTFFTFFENLGHYLAVLVTFFIYSEFWVTFLKKNEKQIQM